MSEADYKLMANLDPEALKQMMGLGTIDDRNQMLTQQMAMAQALRRPDTTQHTTVGGAIGAGFGDIMGNLAGAMKQHSLMDQQQALIGQKDAGRAAYAQALAAALRGQFGPKPQADANGVAMPAQLPIPSSMAGPLGPTPDQGLLSPLTPRAPQQQPLSMNDLMKMNLGA